MLTVCGFSTAAAYIEDYKQCEKKPAKKDYEKNWKN